MKIIFLDIDGVLNSREYDRKRNWNEQTNIDETRMPLVKRLAEATGAKIVLSSTWRIHWNAEPKLSDEDGQYIDKIFAKYGLKIYDKTPDFGIMGERCDEISAWLKEHETENYVIIDDYRYGWKGFTEKLVLTNPVRGLGLEDEHVEKAIKILNG